MKKPLIKADQRLAESKDGGSRTPVELFAAGVAKFEPSILGLLSSFPPLLPN